MKKISPFPVDSNLREIGSDAVSSVAPVTTSFDIKPTFSQRFAFNFNAKIIVAAKVRNPPESGFGGNWKFLIAGQKKKQKLLQLLKRKEKLPRGLEVPISFADEN